MELTDEAVKEFKGILENGKKGRMVKLMTSKSCCGPSFKFDIVDKEAPDDEKVAHGDFTLIVERKAFELVKNTAVTFIDGQFFFKKTGK
jgi:Fe-S cluster assembly iron-binding protein IscA